MRETTLERKQPCVKMINIPVDSVADPVGAGKRRFDPVESVKATHRAFTVSRENSLKFKISNDLELVLSIQKLAQVIYRDFLSHKY